MGLINLDSLGSALQPIAEAIQSLADAVDRVASISEQSVQLAKALRDELEKERQEQVKALRDLLPPRDRSLN